MGKKHLVELKRRFKELRACMDIERKHCKKCELFGYINCLCDKDYIDISTHTKIFNAICKI